MIKKAYIDPITDYLLHDPDYISSRGAVGRGSLTLGGILGGGYLAHKGADMFNNLSKLTHHPTLTGRNKILAMLGAAGLGGVMGHTTGDRLFKYTDSEKLTKSLRRITDRLEENNKIALKSLEAQVGKKSPVEVASGNTSSLWDGLTSKLRPKSNYEKFKDSGKEMLNSLKDTGVNGWEAVKDQFS